MSIIIYFILTIGICIHNEIIVINVFGLNEYTKKRIQKKGDEDYEQTRPRIYSTASTDSYIDDSRGSIDYKRSSIDIEMVDKGIKLSLYESQKTHGNTVSEFTIN